MQGGQAAELSGFMVEGMYFTYQLMKQYKQEGSLAGGYPRFAFHREDSPLIDPSLKRNFDVALIDTQGQSHQAVQIKSGREPQYAPGVTGWAPNKPNVVDHTELIMGCFEALVDNEQSDISMEAAWHYLNDYFEPPKQRA